MRATVKSLPASLVGPDARQRLGAWWRGEPSQSGTQRGGRSQSEDKSAATDWLTVAEQLWGLGALGPGEDGFISRLSATLNLTADKTLAYFGVGLGGAARQIVDKTGAWVVGYEADANAAALGKEQCKRAGLSKKVAISHVTCDFLQLPKERFHAVIAKESFHDVADKGRVFKQIARSLKGSGPFLLTDYFLPGDPLDAGTCSALFGKRSAPVSPSSAGTYLELLKSLDFDTRINEDITELYMGLITEGWSNLRALLDHLGAQAANPVRRMHFLRAVADEAAMWATRLEALRARKLEVRRFLALKPYQPNIVR